MEYCNVNVSIIWKTTVISGGLCTATQITLESFYCLSKWRLLATLYYFQFFYSAINSLCLLIILSCWQLGTFNAPLPQKTYFVVSKAWTLFALPAVYKKWGQHPTPSTPLFWSAATSTNNKSVDNRWPDVCRWPSPSARKSSDRAPRVGRTLLLCTWFGRL